MSRKPVLPSCLLLALAAPLAAQWGVPTGDLDAAGVARALDVSVAPVYRFRYTQGADAYPAPTLSMIDHKRAFAPGDAVSLGFALPPGAKVAEPVSLRAAFSLHDLDGRKHADVGEASLVADAGGILGSVAWTVPDLAEGRYFLALRLSDGAGKTLVTRSEVVFLAPEYPVLLAAAQAALDAARSADLEPRLRASSLPSSEMLVENARMRFDDFGHAPRDWEYIERQLQMARADGEALAAGRDPWQGRTGSLIRAYRSELDGTLQPYALHVPADYDAARGWPLLVSLHGHSSSHVLNRRRVFGIGNRPGESDYEAVRNEDVAYPEVGFLVAAPYGRGEANGYQGIGEDDVLQVMARVEQDYAVDPDRVHLTGLSMGGWGTWHVGLRYPDRFASISPVCAVADVATRMPPDALSDDDRLFARNSAAAALAENALNQRVFIWHGDEDSAVPVEQSRAVVERYRELGWLGESVHYFELPGVHHFAWDFSYRDGSLFEHLRDVRRDPAPEHVVFNTPSIRYDRAYWVRLDRLALGLRLARLEATRGEGVIDVTTDNVAAFSLLLDDARLAPAGETLEVRVDGAPAFRGVPGGMLSFAARDGRFVHVAAPARQGGPPDHGEPGMRTASLAQRRAHLYVYGTAGDAAATAAARALAERLADWGPRIRTAWKVVPDTDVTPELVQGHDLVLVGGAALNRVVAALGERLALHQDADGTYAGERRLAGADAVYRLTMPHPEAPHRYVMVLGAADVDALAPLVSATSPLRGAPPVASAWADYAVLDGEGALVTQGYFHDEWSVGGDR